MEKNKSIDGLSTRRPKKTTTSSKSIKTAPRSTKKITKTTPKTTKSSSQANPKTTAKKTSQPTKVAPKSTPKNPQSKPSPISTTEDFLKPIQAFDFDEQSGQLIASKKPMKKDKKPKKNISKKHKIIKRIAIGLLSLLLLIIIIFIIWGNDIIARITGGQGNVFDLLFQDDNYEPLKTDANGRTNILAFGTSGYDMEGSEGYGVHDGAQLTDSIMIISLNQETGDLAMLSLPRDLKVSDMCTGTGKINEIYWCHNMEGNDEQAGAEALMDEVGNILGIDFQYYTHLNWGSLVSIVDTLGGITVTLDEDINDSYFTGAVFNAGEPYTINGGQALGLARARHGTASGDFTRGASQQKILIGIKDRVFEKSLSISEMLSLANTLGDNLRTNFSINELKTVAHLTSNFDFNAMRQVSLIEPDNYMASATINGISYVIPAGGANYYADIQAYIKKMFNNDPRVYEDASILVLNATNTPGAANTEQNKLITDDYNNVNTDTAPAGDYSGDYILYAITDTKPGSQKYLEDKYNTSALPASELPAQINSNYDFVIIVNKTN